MKNQFIISIFYSSIIFAYNYTIENAFPNLTFQDPVGIYNANDGTDRIFVVEQEGIIKVFNNNNSEQIANIFLDIRSIVNQDPGYTEEGLLGLAFHPNYAENGYFYVNFTDYNPKRNVIARYSVNNNDPNSADEETSLIILEVEQPYTNHNGGQIGFGPDGYLYISFGDGGSSGDPQGNGQNGNTLLGTIVRINIPKSGKWYQINLPYPPIIIVESLTKLSIKL